MTKKQEGERNRIKANSSKASEDVNGPSPSWVKNIITFSTLSKTALMAGGYQEVVEMQGVTYAQIILKLPVDHGNDLFFCETRDEFTQMFAQVYKGIKEANELDSNIKALKESVDNGEFFTSSRWWGKD